MSQSPQGPKIHIDDDWKAQAQAEKQKLAQQTKTTDTKAGSSSRPASAGGMPPANFETLVSTLATQALFAMGAIPDPRTGQRMQHLELARHHIDMLSLIEQKTKNNLSEDEISLLSATLYELRTRYIQLASAARGV